MEQAQLRYQVGKAPVGPSRELGLGVRRTLGSAGSAPFYRPRSEGRVRPVPAGRFARRRGPSVARRAGALEPGAAAGYLIPTKGQPIRACTA